MGRSGILKRLKNDLRAAFDKAQKKARRRKESAATRFVITKRATTRKDSGFGKLVRDDAKIKELKKAFAAATKKQKGAFDRAAWKDATDEEKKASKGEASSF